MLRKINVTSLMEMEMEVWLSIFLMRLPTVAMRKKKHVLFHLPLKRILFLPQCYFIKLGCVSVATMKNH